MAQSSRQPPQIISIDDDEFGDDLMLDEAAEQSLQQIEDAFQTQVLSQQSFTHGHHSSKIRQQQSKRVRSPSFVTQNELPNNKHQRIQPGPSTIADSINGQRSEEQRKVQQLIQKLAQKDLELEKVKKDFLSKTGEVEIIRRRYHDHVSESGKLLLQKEESIQKNLSLAESFRQANEQLVTENKTLKAFRSFEAGTNASNQLWSSVTASVARRRANAAATTTNGTRDYSQSHSQSLAAAVGLTTPTKRNARQAARAAAMGGSSSGGGRASPSSGHLNPDDSPSARARKRQETSLQSSGEKRSVRKPAFPGFINSFSKPILATETQPFTAAAKKKTNVVNGNHKTVHSIDTEDDGIFQDTRQETGMLDSSPTRLLNRTEQPSSPSEIRVGGHTVHSSPLPPPQPIEVGPTHTSRWSDPKVRQMWACKKYADRQTFLAGLILGHESNPRSTTLQKLLQVNLPINKKFENLQDEYTLAVHHFLLALSNGSAIALAEERFEFLLEEFEGLEQEKQTDFENKEEFERSLLFDCLQDIEEGIFEVIEKVFRELQIMLAIACKVEAFDRMFDILSLMRSIIIHFPAGVAGLTDEGLETYIYYDANEGKEKMTQQIQIEEESQIIEPEMQHDAATSLQRRQERRLEMRMERILLSGLRWATGTTQKDKDQKESLLGAIVGILELMAHQCIHNDVVSLHCVYMLKAIFEEPGILISLLVENNCPNPRSSIIVQRVLAILTQTCQHDSLWRVALACKPAFERMEGGIARNRPLRFKDNDEEHIDLFDTLSNFLMMDRKLGIDIHDIHRSIIIFFSQLAFLHPLTGSPFIVQSKQILAAIVKSLHMDTDLIWNDEQFSIGVKNDTLDKLIKAVKRICMDVRFMASMYCKTDKTSNGEDDNQRLAKALSSSSMQLIMNGVRNSFIVALSLIAFASEPDWMQILMDVDERVEEARTMINDVNEMAADLLELVLSPDEIEACYEALVEDEEEVEEEDEEGEEMQKEVANQKQTTQKQKQPIVGEVINLESDDDDEGDNDVQMM